MIIVNTKNYKQGKRLFNLARLVKKYNKNIVMAVPASEISSVSRIMKVYAQHVDISDDRSTGFTNVCDVKAAGASGALLNHSEHRLKFSVLKKTVVECKKHRLKVIICVSNMKQAKLYAKFKPHALAFEDTKLIGSGKSVTRYKPMEILRFVDFCGLKGIMPLCGAGISNADDVRAAYELGCKGVLIASAVAKSKNPRAILKSLCECN